MWRYLAPLGLFIVLVIFLGVGLKLDPREVPSPLIGKQAPAFNLPELLNSDKQVNPDNFLNQVWILNVWASWCVSCRAEHTVLNQLSKITDVPLIGLNYKDTRFAGQQWLLQRGNPYRVNAFDEAGRAGIDWGVYGVPETFIMDKKGLVRHKHTGPLNMDDVNNEILPLIKQLQQEQTS